MARTLFKGSMRESIIILAKELETPIPRKDFIVKIKELQPTKTERQIRKAVTKEANEIIIRDEEKIIRAGHIVILQGNLINKNSLIKNW